MNIDNLMGPSTGQYEVQKANTVPRQMSVRERLVQNKRHLEAQLTHVNAALAGLDENPNVEKVLELLGRAI